MHLSTHHTKSTAVMQLWWKAENRLKATLDASKIKNSTKVNKSMYGRRDLEDHPHCTLQNNGTVHKKSHNISLSRCLYSWKWVNTHSTVQTILRGTCLSNYEKTEFSEFSGALVWWMATVIGKYSVKTSNHFQMWWTVKIFIVSKLSLLLCGIITPCNLFQNLLLTFSHHLHKRTITVPSGISHMAFWPKK